MNDELKRPDAHAGAREARSEERGKLMLEAPKVELPKGGGAIASIGESFEVRSLTGTASLTVPLAAPPGRQGFGPSLALSYDSGAGQGPFGMGWSLDAPSIVRLTDKRLPRYSETDRFALAGSELVPVGELADEEVDSRIWKRTRFRHREEGAFDWIELLQDGPDRWWRVRGRDNTLRIFGKSRSARTTDPQSPRRTFEWHLEEIRDERGNVAWFGYKQEDGADVENTPAERYRDRHGGSTWTYLKRVRYGNRTPELVDPAAAAVNEWCFELVFDYGEHTGGSHDEQATWPQRLDPFSRYNAGFDRRCHRLCRQVLAFHIFPTELGNDPVLVRSTALTYQEAAATSVLTTIEHRGHRDTTTLTAPPLTLTYQEALAEAHWKPIEGAPPDPTRWQWADLDGEGLPGLLSEQGGHWFFSANAGGGRLEAPRRLTQRPNASLDRARLMDIDGDGELELALLGPDQWGAVDRTEQGWDRMRMFRKVPTVALDDPNIRWIDLDGDGRPEIVLTEEHAFVWWPSEGSAGFGHPKRVRRVLDERDGPTLLFAAQDESVFLADMSGDGLTDLVRIRNGRVCYWPNLGHGKFGAKIVLSGVPVFDRPDRFDPARIRLVDVDGTGPTDVLYVGPDGVRWWPNLAGNALGVETHVPIPVHDHADVQVADVYGEGTTCLVWRSRLEPARPLKALRLMADGKPWLLKSHANGLGQRVTLHYTPSTAFYLADRRAGAPWVTRIPFVVHCLARVETHDAITGWHFASRTTYHHGFYDGVEREFRGFGRVEQFDLESVGSTHAEPEVRTVSWFHTGAWERERALLAQFTEEDWDGPIPTVETPTIPTGSGAELRQGHRALRGKLLRKEVFAEDEDPTVAAVPYVVEAHEYEVRRLQDADGEQPGVFHCVPGRSLTVQLERIPDDPRIGWSVPLEIDEFGEVRRSVAIGEPRVSPAIAEQGIRTIVLTERDVAHVDDGAVRHIAVEYGTRTFELTGYTGAPTAAALDAEIASATSFDYHETPTGVALRTLTVTRTRYWNDALSGPYVPPNPQDPPIAARRLVYDTRALAATEDELTAIGYPGGGTPMGDGHEQVGDEWWLPSGHVKHDTGFTDFYTPAVFVDPFGNETTVTYDADTLFPIEVEDELGNTTTIEVDRITLAPASVTDANGAISEVAFDALTRVVKSARRGPSGEGDTLTDPSVVVTYEHDRFVTSGDPARVKVEQRETHQDPSSRWTETWTYSDGRGQVVMEKVRAEDDGGPRWVGTGRVVLDEKARPIRRYEPFFSTTAEFEAEEGFSGVSATLHYDAVGRAIRVGMPDGTFERVVFDAWSEEVWDASDTVLESTWHSDRVALLPGDKKRVAAEQSAMHANTPTERLLDALGRPVRVRRHAGFDQGSPVLYESTVELDVQGNALAVTDARDVVVQQDTVDRLGRVLYSTSPDAGEMWQVVDADDQVSTVWKSGDLKLVTTFDELRRPLAVERTVGSTTITVEKYEYGESATGGYRKGRLWKRWDPAGYRELTHDFKGNVIATDQQVVLAGIEADWSQSTTQLSSEVFRTEVDLDALDRPVEQRSPGAEGAGATAKQAWTYTRRGQLQSVSVAPRGGTLTPRISDITYDARGQRKVLTRSVGSNGDVVTTYTYDAETFRLVQLTTTRPSGMGGTVLQNLSYFYDAVGNVSHKVDATQDNIFFDNDLVTPDESYLYDALHRLIQATGRESVSGITGPDDVAYFVSALPATTDTSAMRRYTESYTYDEADNLTRQHHFAGTGGQNPVWERIFTVDTGSNKLVSTTDGSTTWPVTYNDRGAVTALTHLPTMSRDHRDQLVGLTFSGSDTASYRYDADGQRVVRRVTKGGKLEERLYLGATEVFRRFDTQGALEHERWSQWVSDGVSRVLVLDQIGAEHDDADLEEDEERWQLSDLLGSGTVEMDGSGAVISAEGYHPYGSTAWALGRTQREVKSRRFRYTGKERDDESGLQAHGVRMYAPWLGRWMSADPIGLGDGLNRHLYVHANPVRGRDTTGTGTDEAPKESANLYLPGESPNPYFPGESGRPIVVSEATDPTGKGQRSSYFRTEYFHANSATMREATLALAEGSLRRDGIDASLLVGIDAAWGDPDVLAAYSPEVVKAYENALEFPLHAVAIHALQQVSDFTATGSVEYAALIYIPPSMATEFELQKTDARPSNHRASIPAENRDKIRIDYYRGTHVPKPGGGLTVDIPKPSNTHYDAFGHSHPITWRRENGDWTLKPGFSGADRSFGIESTRAGYFAPKYGIPTYLAEHRQTSLPGLLMREYSIWNPDPGDYGVSHGIKEGYILAIEPSPYYNPPPRWGSR